jgi:hypothetical protein
MSLLGRSCSNNKNNSSAEAFSISVKPELQTKFHLQSWLTHSPMADIEQSWCADLINKSGKDSLNGTVPTHFSFQKPTSEPSPKILLM